MLSKRARNIEESATLAITSKINELKRQGVNVYGFGAGEPDFPTPENIRKAAIKAINEGFTKYTPVPGIPELREAICEKFRRENGISYETNQVMVSNGGKQVLQNAIFCLIDKGDEVIIPRPYWVSYIEQVKLADGKPVICETENFRLKADLILEKITDHTKVLILNSPNNPSGMICEKGEIKKIADMAIENNIYVLSDEVYEKLIYDGKEHFSIASINEEIRNLTITINAVSKTYSMTGWRLGYVGGPFEIIKAMNNIQSHMTSGASSISQKAALEALTGPQDSILRMVSEFDKRRKFMLKRLEEMGLECIRPEGAFYAFPSIEFRKGSIEFSDRLLDEQKVAVVPGKAFGCDQNIRLSYAASMETIERGLEGIEKFVRKLT
jgi:aspartate aminotransferase